VLRYIEPLLLSWFLLYDPRFEPFRKHLSPALSFKLRLYFRVKAYDAYKADLKREQHHFLFREKQNAYAQIWKARKGDPFVRLVSRLIRKD
jgi:hypothetical protein